MRVLIVGCGYIGLPLGAELFRQGHEVFGLRHTVSAQKELEAVGIRPLFADITKPQDLAGLPAAFDWVVNCVASGGGSADDYRRIYLQGMQNLLDWLAPRPPKKFVYTSSTSVYGQNDGSRVDETSPTEPVTETARVLVETEKLLRQTAEQNNFPAIILRLAGIYGPGRGHWLRQYLKNEARIEGKGDRFLNMIHRDDVVGAIIAALQGGRPGEIYNVADDEPVSQIAFFEWLSNALTRPLPPSIPEKSTARKRGATNKQVSNRKLKDELGYQFKYPDFRKGYSAEILRLR